MTEPAPTSASDSIPSVPPQDDIQSTPNANPEQQEHKSTDEQREAAESAAQSSQEKEAGDHDGQAAEQQVTSEPAPAPEPAQEVAHGSTGTSPPDASAEVAEREVEDDKMEAPVETTASSDPPVEAQGTDNTAEPPTTAEHSAQPNGPETEQEAQVSAQAEPADAVAPAPTSSPPATEPTPAASSAAATPPVTSPPPPPPTTTTQQPSSASPAKPVLPAKKFSSINVNKKFLEKAGASGPQTPALGGIGSPGSASSADGHGKASLASPSLASARLRATKAKDASASPSVGSVIAPTASRLADTSSPRSSATSPVAGETTNVPAIIAATVSPNAASKIVTAPPSGAALAAPATTVPPGIGTSALRTRSPAAQASDDGHRATPSPSLGPRHAVLSVKSTTLTSTGSGGNAGAGGGSGSGAASKAPWANLVSAGGTSAQPTTSTATATATASSTSGGASAARFAASLAGGGGGAGGASRGFGSGGGEEPRYGPGGRWGDRGYGGFEGSSHRPRDIVPGPSAFPPLGSDTREFPTAAEAKLRQREKEARGTAGSGGVKHNAASAAAAAAASAAANEDALRSLDRFRGESLSGNRWGDLLGDGDDSDDDGQALFGKDGVVDFGDGQVYRIDPQEAERQRKEKEKELEQEASRREEVEVSKWGRLKESERIPGGVAGLKGSAANVRGRELSADSGRDAGSGGLAAASSVSKEDRFADMNHDRSWPGAGAGGARRRDSAFSNHHDDGSKPAPAKATPAPWGPLAIAQGKISRANAGGPPGVGASGVSAAPNNRKVSFGQQDGAAVADPASLRAPAKTRPPPVVSAGPNRGANDTAAAAAPAPAVPARLWGPLAQRAASLGFAPPPAPVVPVSSTAASSGRGPSHDTAKSGPALPAGPAAASRLPATGGSERPLPPHLLVRGARLGDNAQEREQRRTEDVDASGHRVPPPPVSGANPLSSTLTPATQQSGLADKSAPLGPGSGVQLAEVQQKEMLSAAERARRRREEEEAQRAAERERARLKALALEKKLDAERAEKERVAKAKAEAEAAAARKKQEEVAAAAERRKKEQMEAVERKRRTAEEAQARALAKKDAEVAEAEARERQRVNRATEEHMLQAGGNRPPHLAQLRRTSDQRPEDGASQGAFPGRKPPLTHSASLEQSTWRRTSAPSSVEIPARSPELSQNPPVVSILPRKRPSESEIMAGTGPVRSPATEKGPLKSPAPPTPSAEASTWRRRDPLPPTAPPAERPQSSRVASHGERAEHGSSDAYKTNLDDIISRIKGAIHSTGGAANQAVVSLPSRRFPQRAGAAQVRKSPLDAVDVVTVGDDVLATLNGSEKRARVRFGSTITTTFGKGTVPKVPDRSLLSETRALRSSLASRLLRPMGGMVEAPKEPLTTRSEVIFEPAPVWSRFSVRIKPSRPAPYLTRQQMQAQRVALANANVQPRSIYPLTWDPPLLTLPFKTLNRDDQFFPKKFQQGKVITMVQLPRKRFAKFLGPAKVSSVIAPSTVDAFFAPQTASEPMMDGYQRKGKGKVPAKQHPVVKLPFQQQRKLAVPEHSQVDVDARQKVRAGSHISPSSSAAPEQDARQGNPRDRASAAATSGYPSASAVNSYEGRDHVPPFEEHARRAQPNGIPAPLAQKPFTSPKARKDSFSGVAFSKALFGHVPTDQMSTNSPSPVSFMVHSELEGPGTPGRDLPPHLALAKDGSKALGGAKPRSVASMTAAAQSQLPNALPSPGRHSTAFQAWGFPSSGPSTESAPGIDLTKNVWTFQASKDDTDVQKGPRPREAEFVGPSMSLSIHDLRTEGGAPAAQASRSAVAVQASKSFPRYNQPNGTVAGADGALPQQAGGAVSIATTAANSPMLQQQAEVGTVRTPVALDYVAHQSASRPNVEGPSYTESSAVLVQQSSPSASRPVQSSGTMPTAASMYKGSSYGASPYQTYAPSSAYAGSERTHPGNPQLEAKEPVHQVSAYASAFQPAAAAAAPRYYAEQKAPAAYAAHGGYHGQVAAMPSPAGSWPSPVASQTRPVAPASWTSAEQQAAYRWQSSAESRTPKYGQSPAAQDPRHGTDSAYSPQQQQAYGLYGGTSSTMNNGSGQRMYADARTASGYGLEGRAPIGSLSQHLSPQMLTSAQYPQTQQYSYLQQQQASQSQQAARGPMQRYGQQQYQQSHPHQQAQAQAQAQQQQQQQQQQQHQQHYQQTQTYSNSQQPQLAQANYAYFHDPNASFW
ncbi:hypothetical protein CF319_g4653 [Tilletia indica]|nr:hypothetical protein CF319_g4653 [Tilletia indica]